MVSNHTHKDCYSFTNDQFNWIYGSFCHFINFLHDLLSACQYLLPSTYWCLVSYRVFPGIGFSCPFRRGLRFGLADKRERRDGKREKRKGQEEEARFSRIREGCSTRWPTRAPGRTPALWKTAGKRGGEKGGTVHKLNISFLKLSKVKIPILYLFCIFGVFSIKSY